MYQPGHDRGPWRLAEQAQELRQDRHEDQNRKRRCEEQQQHDEPTTDVGDHNEPAAVEPVGEHTHRGAEHQPGHDAGKDGDEDPLAAGDGVPERNRCEDGDPVARAGDDAGPPQPREAAFLDERPRRSRL